MDAKAKRELPLALEAQVKQEPPQPPEVLSTTSPSTVPPYLNADFQGAMELTVRNAENILEILRMSPRDGNPSQSHIVETENMAKYPRPTKRTIGLVGPSGAGKGSLICSILEVDAIAIVDGSGNAMTSFPVSYSALLPGHTKTFTIRAVFPNDSQLESRFSTLLDDLNSLSQSSDLGDLTTSEFEDVQQRSLSAKATFRALFSKMPGFFPRQAPICQRAGFQDVCSHKCYGLGFRAALACWNAEWRVE